MSSAPFAHIVAVKRKIRQLNRTDFARKYGYRFYLKKDRFGRLTTEARKKKASK